MSTSTRWGVRAAALYARAYARQYRASDERIGDSAVVTRLGGWLRSLCERADRPIDVLDLGCGTGRYFHVLCNVRRLVGIDVSGPMLEEARQPVGGPAWPASTVTLIKDDFLLHAFEPETFDLVYSIGVLAEHSPFDLALARRVHEWVKPGGWFAFTAVHVRSFSVPRTLKRRAGEWMLPLTTGPWRRRLRDRLMHDGLYADEERLQAVLTAAGFCIESIEPFESDVHSHLLCVARRKAR